MSRASIEAILDRYQDMAVAECAAGQGHSLMLNFVRDIGADFASTVFLKMTVELERATDETADAVFEWAQGYPEQAANTLAEAVRDGWIVEAGSAPCPELDAVEHAAVTSFGARLNMLLAPAQPGGEA